MELAFVFGGVAAVVIGLMILAYIAGYFFSLGARDMVRNNPVKMFNTVDKHNGYHTEIR